VKLGLFLASFLFAIVALQSAAFAGSPNLIVVTSGGNQSANDTTKFSNQFSVSIQQPNGHGGETAYNVAGVRVQFVAPPFTATTSGTPPTTASGVFDPTATLCATPADGTCVIVTTDSNGNATAPAFYANAALGSYSVSVSLPDFPSVSSASVTPLTNTLGPVAAVKVVSPTTNITLSPGAALGSQGPLTVETVDAGGNAVGSVKVTFSVIANPNGAGGQFGGGASETVTSDALTGLASVSDFTANNTQGLYSIKASIPGSASTSFALNNGAGAASNIAITVGGTSCTTSLSAKSPPVCNASLTSGSFGAITVKVTDSSGNAVQNQSVVITVPPAVSGNLAPPSGAFGSTTGSSTASLNTDSNGIATTPALYSNGVAGSFTVTVLVGSVTATGPTLGNQNTQPSVTSQNNFTQYFNLTNPSGAPAKIQVYAGPPVSNNQATAIGSPFGINLEALVTDSNGNAVTSAAGAYVAFTAPTGTFAAGAGNVAIGSNGVAIAPAFTAPSTSGPITVTATLFVNNVSTASTTFSLSAVGVGSVTAVSGTSTQTTPVTTQFPRALSVTVLDTTTPSGKPLAGATVVYTVNAGSTGAGGVFSGNLTTASATTNSVGVASIPITANTTAGSFTVTASVGGFSTTFNLTNTAGAPNKLVLLTGGGQSAIINTQFANALSATLQDANGNIVPGVTVNFAAPTAAGPSGTFLQSSNTQAAVLGVVTDANGVATTSKFTANGTQGSYVVTASVPGASGVAPVTFSLTNTVASAGSIAIVSGTPQSTVAGTPFGAPLIAVVKDTGGNVLAGVPVTFTAVPGIPAVSGSPAQSGVFPGNGNQNTQTVTTGSNGQASVSITANNYVGAFTVTAAAQGVTSNVTYILTNTLPANVVPVVTAQSGGGQTAPVLTAFSKQLQVLVADGSGNPLAGVKVTFQAPGSGASGNFVTGGSSAIATTNASGVATSPTFVANTTAGTYNVSATYQTASANFSLTNTSNTRLVVDPTPVMGTTPQSTPVSTPFKSALAVTVTDANGNPISNASITFSAPATGPSGTFANGTVMDVELTNGSGVATSTTFTANATPGSYTVIAYLTGDPTQPSAQFSMTNIPNAGLTIAVNSTGRDGTFNFTAAPAVNGTSAFSITTSGGAASRSFTNANGTYTVTLGQLAFGYKLTSVTCTGSGIGSGTGATATVSLVAGNNETCTFAIVFQTDTIRTATQAAIRGFIQNRADAITSSQPRQTRGEGRFKGTLFGGSSSDDSDDDQTSNRPRGTGFTDGSPALPQPPLNSPALAVGSATARRDATVQQLTASQGSTDTSVQSPLSLSGSDGIGGGTASAFISLSAIRTAALQLDAAKAKEAGLAYNVGQGGAGYSNPSTFDMWAEIDTNYFRSTIANKQSGYTQLAYFGMDYLIHPAVLIGILTEVDWAKESGQLAPLGVSGSSANGVGWMVGPYTAMKLTPQVTFDARVAYGQSNNAVNPFGLYDDTFNTDRALAAARLSGTWRYGPWRISPEASLIYFNETQKSFTDALGIFIPGQSVNLGRFTFGPEVGYPIRERDGTVYEPYLGLKGVYDFSKQDAVALDGSLSAPETLRGKVEAGVSYKTSSGMAIQGSASYDGLGAKGFEDIQGQVSLRMPLN
jgi:hypothetical protein